MHKLTGKQCKQARSLLKWNVYDLAGKVNGINPKRIESFERGNVHIAEWENNEMVTAFRKDGVQFTAELDVKLVSDKLRKNTRMTSGDGAHIQLGGDMSIVADTTADIVQDKLKPVNPEDEEDEEAGR